MQHPSIASFQTSFKLQLQKDIITFFNVVAAIEEKKSLDSELVVDKQKLIDLFSQCKYQAQKVQGIATKLNNNSVSLLRVGELLYPDKARREATKLEERAGVCLTAIVQTSIKLAEAILHQKIVYVCDNMVSTYNCPALPTRGGLLS